MPIDFSKISPSNFVKRPINPIELFQSLKVNDSSINDLWLAQGDALREWDAKRACDDIAIVLNTGAGKTLVGLLAAQSLVNETQERVLYVCSSIQLVEQTESKANGYGIDVTTYFKQNFSNNLYERCLAPCITTYQAIFNGKSRFPKDNPRAIIFDDAHTAEHLLRDHFTLRIKKQSCPDLFSPIFELFRDYHVKTGVGVSYQETRKNQEPYRFWFIPPFVVYEQKNELERLLIEGNLSQNEETMFAWEYLKDHIDLCTLFISGQEINFTPPIIPVNSLPYFKKGVRRLYLSATLAADDKFIRTFGKRPKIIAPKTTAGECERFIVFPGLNKQCESDINIAKRIIKGKKTLILVPYKSYENKWSDVLTQQESDNVTQKVENFKKSKSDEKLLLIGRYDGVDLPGDTCRLMVIDGLPSSLNPLERYFWEQLELVKSLRSVVASRIAQGFGRISRGMSDHGVVVITDKKLVDWLLNPKNQSALPLFLRQQIKVGINISDKTESIDDLIDGASQCLKRDTGWMNYYQQNMEQSISENEASSDSEALKIAHIEMEFGNAFWRRNYTDAAKYLEQSLEETFNISNNTGAWHLLWLGYCYELLDQRDEAYDAYQRSHNVAQNIPPLHLQDFSKTDQNLLPQVCEVARYLHKGGPQMRREIPKTFDSDLALLDGTGTSGQTEEALRSLGRYLGLKASRPDKEFNTGPDVLWEISCGHPLSLEVKTDKKPNSHYTKNDLGQLRDHYQWVKERSESSVIYSAFVGKRLSPSDSANPDEETMVIELKEFQEIAQRLRAALSDICARTIPTNVPETVLEVFQQRNLLWPALYENMKKITLRDLG